MKYLVYILLFLSLTGFAQSSKDESLIVIHYDTEGKTELKQSIYRYNFINNVYAGKEKIMSVVGRKNDKDYVRCDKGENTLYKDRYLITGMGNVIDLKEKKVVFDGSAKLIKCSNDSIIFYTNDAFKGKFYSYYDTKSNSYSEIKTPTFKAIKGQDIEFDRAKSPYKLYYYPQNKPKVVLMEDAGHGGVSSTSKLSAVPVYWIDNTTFIFPNVKITNLEGAIVKYNIDTKVAKELGTFNSTSSTAAIYKLEKANNATFVEFYFKEKLYMINPAKETMLLSNYKEFDSNFSVEVQPKATGRAIFFKGKEIAKNHFELYNFKASQNHAAIVKEINMGDETYQQGMAIYVIEKAKWENIDCEDVASLVGWIKK